MTNTVLEIVEVKTELVIGAVGQQTVLEINEPQRVELLTVGIQGPSGASGAKGDKGDKGDSSIFTENLIFDGGNF